MYSKRMNSSMIIGLFSLALVFCARENEPYSSPVRYDGQQLIQGSSKSTIKEESECIDNAGAILKRFVRGELSEKQLVGFWNCLDRILNLVNTKVSKPDGKGLTSKELTNLIQFMFKEHRQNIDAELMNEVLVVKQVLVGGQSQYLSEVDLVQLRSLMREFKLITLSLRTKIGVIGTAFFQNSQVPNPQQLQPAREYLLDAAHELAVLFSRNKKPYRFNNLKNLIAQIDRLRGKKTLKAESSSLLKYIDLLVGAKALLVGPDKTAIQKNEWSRFFKVVSEALVVWSRYSHYMGKEDSDMTQGTALEQTEAIAHVFAHEVAYALKSRGRPFSHDEIDFLLTAMGRAELKVLNLSTEDLKKLARKAVDRLLVPIGVKDQPGYALMNHKVLIEEFKVWYSIQSLSNNIVDQLQVTQRDQIIALVEKAAQKQPRVRELARVLRGVWPLVVDSKGRPVVQNNLQKGYDQHSLATLNWIRMLVRVFIRSYAEDKERAQKMTGLLYSDRQGEKDKEFSVLFEDLRPFLESEDLIEILKDKNGAPLVPHPFMAKVYRDTALFLPRSNGDHIINYEEGIEYIHYVYAGTKAKNYILESLFPKVNNKGRVLNGDKHIVPCSIQDFTLKKESRTKHRSELTREDVTHINGDQCYRKKFTSYFMY